MKIFKLDRVDRIGWDEYEGFVVVAESEDDAWAVLIEEHTPKSSRAIEYYFKKENFEISEIDSDCRGIELSAFNAG